MSHLEDAYWEGRFSGRANRIKSSAIRELLKMAQQPGMITFSGGLPSPDLFPVEALAEASDKVLRARANEALQYGPTEGYTPLRRWVADQHGVDVEQTLIVSGSQQGLDLMGKIFIHPGDRVVVESPTYMGGLQAFNPYEPEYLSVKLGDAGMDLERLEAALRTGPKFLYVLPTFQNPSGALLGLEQRRRVVELAAQYSVPILEDDAYAALYFSGAPLPTLFELDRQMRGGAEGNVIYLSTFSKTLTPGLRVAWVVGPKVVTRKLVQAKQGTDLHTPSFNQMVVYEVARQGLGPQIRRITHAYAQKRDHMRQALEAHLPAPVRWNDPQGGMFYWLTLPEGLDATDLFKAALEQKVAFVPGEPFHADGSGRNTLRLAYSMPTLEQIEDGVGRLGRAVEAMLAVSR